jgi:hypothetical protein
MLHTVRTKEEDKEVRIRYGRWGGGEGALRWCVSHHVPVPDSIRDQSLSLNWNIPRPVQEGSPIAASIDSQLQQTIRMLQVHTAATHD